MSHRPLRRWIGMTAVVVPLQLAACGQREVEPRTTPKQPHETLAVIAESLPTFIPVDGNVAARRRAEIATRMMARVRSVPVDVGSLVQAGGTLIELGVDDIAANRSRAEAAVRAARAARDEARRHAARMDTLLAQDAVPRVRRDQAHLALTQAEAQLTLAQASLREVETEAGYATIVAPFTGTVVDRSVDPGDVAAPGAPLIVLEDRGPRDGVLFVPVGAAGDLEVGGKLWVETPTGMSGWAPVRAIAGAADPASRSVTVKVGLPANWPSGSSLAALIPAGRHEGVAIPASAVVRRGQLTGVRLSTPQGVSLRWIRLGRLLPKPAAGGPGPARVEVLSGLAPGERIAL